MGFHFFIDFPERNDSQQFNSLKYNVYFNLINFQNRPQKAEEYNPVKEF